MGENKEVIVTDPKTGGQKGMKDERFELIPWNALAEVARVYGYGARKYAAHNWWKGYSWSLSLGALLRHVATYACGVSRDQESGRHHLAHAVFHCLTLITFEREGLGSDDRVLEGEVEGPEYVESTGVLRTLWERAVVGRSGAEPPREGVTGAHSGGRVFSSSDAGSENRPHLPPVGNPFRPVCQSEGEGRVRCAIPSCYQPYTKRFYVTEVMFLPLCEACYGEAVAKAGKNG